MSINRHIPNNSVKVADKHSSAVAYLYTNAAGKPCAKIYSGKRDKPDGHHYFKDDAARAKSVRYYFENTKAREESVAERKAKRKETGRGLEVGDILYTNWGCDQTNVEFFEVVELIGKTMVAVREIAQTRENTECWEQWRTMPVKGDYIGGATRHVAKDGSIKFASYRYAWKWDGRPKSASGYA